MLKIASPEQLSVLFAWFVRRQYRQRTPRNPVSGALTRVRVSRTIKGARVSIVPEMKIILVFRLVASLGKYALENKMRIYALMQFSQKTVWRLYTGEVENSHVRFHKSSHQSKPVSKLLTLTGWAGKAFIRYRRCLLPKTKPREYQTVTLKGGPYLGQQIWWELYQ